MLQQKSNIRVQHNLLFWTDQPKYFCLLQDEIQEYKELLGVIVSKNQARSTDRGCRILSKLSAFFLYQIRLRLMVFLVQKNKFLRILTTP